MLVVVLVVMGSCRGPEQDHCGWFDQDSWFEARTDQSHVG